MIEQPIAPSPIYEAAFVKRPAHGGNAETSKSQNVETSKPRQEAESRGRGSGARGEDWESGSRGRGPGFLDDRRQGAEAERFFGMQ